MLLGNAAAQHPQASQLLALAQLDRASRPAPPSAISPKPPTRVGAQLVSALPGEGGLDAGQMLSQPTEGLLLLNVEPAFDCGRSGRGAPPRWARPSMVVALTPFTAQRSTIADVLLPIAPFSETAGTFVNAEGRAQSFHGVVKPLGDTRPAWKVLRVLGNLLGLQGFEHETSEEVRDEALGDADAATRRPTQPRLRGQPPRRRCAALERVADVPIYCTDPLVRRAPRCSSRTTPGRRWSACRPRCGAARPGAMAHGARDAGRRSGARCRLEARAGADAVRVPPAMRRPPRWARCSAPSVVKTA